MDLTPATTFPSDGDLATRGGRARAAVAATPGADDELARIWDVASGSVDQMLTDDLTAGDLFDISAVTDLPSTWLAGQTPENLTVSIRLGRPPVGVRCCYGPKD